MIKKIRWIKLSTRLNGLKGIKSFVKNREIVKQNLKVNLGKIQEVKSNNKEKNKTFKKEAFDLKPEGKFRAKRIFITCSLTESLKTLENLGNQYEVTLLNQALLKQSGVAIEELGLRVKSMNQIKAYVVYKQRIRFKTLEQLKENFLEEGLNLLSFQKIKSTKEGREKLKEGKEKAVGWKRVEIEPKGLWKLENPMKKEEYYVSSLDWFETERPTVEENQNGKQKIEVKTLEERNKKESDVAEWKNKEIERREEPITEKEVWGRAREVLWESEVTLKNQYLGAASEDEILKNLCQYLIRISKLDEKDLFQHPIAEHIFHKFINEDYPVRGYFKIPEGTSMRKLQRTYEEFSQGRTYETIMEDFIFERVQLKFQKMAALEEGAREVLKNVENLNKKNLNRLIVDILTLFRGTLLRALAEIKKSGVPLIWLLERITSEIFRLLKAYEKGQDLKWKESSDELTKWLESSRKRGLKIDGGRFNIITRPWLKEAKELGIMVIAGFFILNKENISLVRSMFNKRIVMNLCLKTTPDLEDLLEVAAQLADWPMVCKPVPWTRENIEMGKGGYLINQSTFMQDNLFKERKKEITEDLIKNVNYLQEQQLKIDVKALRNQALIYRLLSLTDMSYIEDFGISRELSQELNKIKLNRVVIEQGQLVESVELLKKYYKYQKILSSLVTYARIPFYNLTRLDFRGRVYMLSAFSQTSNKLSRSLLAFGKNAKKRVWSENEKEEIKRQLYFTLKKDVKGFFEKTTDEINEEVEPLLKKSDWNLQDLIFEKKPKEVLNFIKFWTALKEEKEKGEAEIPLVEYDCTASVVQIIGTLTRESKLMKISNVGDWSDEGATYSDPYIEIYNQISEEEKLRMFRETLKKKSEAYRSTIREKLKYSRWESDDAQVRETEEGRLLMKLQKLDWTEDYLKDSKNLKLKKLMERLWIRKILKAFTMTYFYSSPELEISKRISEIDGQRESEVVYWSITSLMVQILEQSYPDTMRMLNFLKDCVSVYGKANRSLKMVNHFISYENKYFSKEEYEVNFSIPLNGIKVLKENTKFKWSSQTEEAYKRYQEENPEKLLSKQEFIENAGLALEDYKQRSWKSKFTVYSKKTLDIRKMRSAVLPNFIQGMDAYANMRIISNFRRERKNILSVHDCWLVKPEEIELLKKSYNEFLRDIYDLGLFSFVEIDDVFLLEKNEKLFDELNYLTDILREKKRKEILESILTSQYVLTP